MQKEAVQLSDAWACLVNAATSRVFDVDRHATPLASELLRHLCRRFNDQYVPRSNDELLQRHMQMTGLLAIVGADLSGRHHWSNDPRCNGLMA